MAISRHFLPAFVQLNFIFQHETCATEQKNNKQDGTYYSWDPVTAVAVFLKKEVAKDLIINIVLCVCFWIPGILRALWVELV